MFELNKKLLDYASIYFYVYRQNKTLTDWPKCNNFQFNKFETQFVYWIQEIETNYIVNNVCSF